MASSSPPADMSLAARRERHGRVSSALRALSDREVRELLSTPSPFETSIGGATTALEVDGLPVFVKRVPLTDLELLADNTRSTANLFDVPTWAHYGVGSVGAGAWRELAAHVLTTDWVLTEECENFVLLHHWRLVPTAPPTPMTPKERAAIARAAHFWHDHPGIRARFEALATSSADLVLFLEHIPRNLATWLGEQALEGDAQADDACTLADRDLRAVAAFSAARGFQHFDAHFRNILTDGHRLYLTDFGLALTAHFDLTPAECRFLAEHIDHDTAYAAAALVNWIVSTLSETGRRGLTPFLRNGYVKWAAEGNDVPGLPPGAAALVRRYAEIAVVVNDFYYELHTHSRKVPFPVDLITKACASL